MKPKAPPRVKDVEKYWGDEPPELSPRCKWWVARIQAGWRRNGRVASLGYYASAEYFGVYLWEWLNAIWPMLQKLEER